MSQPAMRKVTVRCIDCGQNFQLIAPKLEFLVWDAGTWDQPELRGLTSAQRELLFSNTCSKCLDTFFNSNERYDNAQ